MRNEKIGQHPDFYIHKINFIKCIQITYISKNEPCDIEKILYIQHIVKSKNKGKGHKEKETGVWEHSPMNQGK